MVSGEIAPLKACRMSLTNQMSCLVRLSKRLLSSKLPQRKVDRFYKNGVVMLSLTQLEVAIKQEVTHLKLWLNRYCDDVSTNQGSRYDKIEN